MTSETGARKANAVEVSNGSDGVRLRFQTPDLHSSREGIGRTCALDPLTN